MITREDCFKVGEVAKTHNLQGEVVITTDSDLLEKYADEPVFLLLDGAPVPFFIADEGLTVRNHTSYIVKFDYVDTLAQAGRLVGCEVLFEKELLEGQEPPRAEAVATTMKMDAVVRQELLKMSTTPFHVRVFRIRPSVMKA